MTTTVPIKDTKDTAKFSEMVKGSEDPVIVTRNGREEYVAITVELYDSLRNKAATSELFASLLKSERDAAEGRVKPYAEFRADMRERYGI